MREKAAPGEARRYLGNARAILRHLPVERDIYLDRKPVRERWASRTGPSWRQSTKRPAGEASPGRSQRHLAIRNGKLMREFESLYDLLHIAGYYRGLLNDRKVVRDALDAAQRFIGGVIPLGHRIARGEG